MDEFNVLPEGWVNRPSKIISVTGHRPNKLGGYSEDARLKLVKFAEHCLNKISPTQVLTGMAQGWDLAIAQACYNLELPYTAVIPFLEQDRIWPPETRKLYSHLVENAYTTVNTDPDENGYAPWKLLHRNKYLADHCDALLALWNGDVKGGTTHCVRYACKNEIPTIVVWDEWVDFNGEKYDTRTT